MGTQIKYWVKPGYVKSKNDGDTHFINARQLMELYNVNPSECVVNPANPEGLIILEPSYEGNYSLRNLICKRG
jgi:hypothetical protein